MTHLPNLFEWQSLSQRRHAGHWGHQHRRADSWLWQPDCAKILYSPEMHPRLKIASRCRHHLRNSNTPPPSPSFRSCRISVTDGDEGPLLDATLLQDIFRDFWVPLLFFWKKCSSMAAKVFEQLPGYLENVEVYTLYIFNNPSSKLVRAFRNHLNFHTKIAYHALQEMSKPKVDLGHHKNFLWRQIANPPFSIQYCQNCLPK